MTITDLRGVNYQKYFMPSVANTVGVDLSGYKVIQNGQFACNLMHVGRDECLPIALHRDEKPIIVSPAYLSFEVKDENEILSEFLFLWFKRTEFDREACFYTDADVRQGLIKSSFFDIKVPVPSIEVQRQIVAEYQAVERRIENNRRLIATLEATAQTIYRKMFVDNIDPNNLPQGWRMGKMSEMTEFTLGGDWGKDSQEGNNTSKVFCIRGADIPNVAVNIKGETPIRYLLPKNLTIKKLREHDMVVEISGGTPTKSTGRVCLISDSTLSYFGDNIICSNFCRVIRPKAEFRTYLFFLFNEHYQKGTMFKYENSTNGLKNLDLDAVLKEEGCVIPELNEIKKFQSIVLPILKHIRSIGVEIELMLDIKKTLLKKL